MAKGWINDSTRPANRTTFAENPGMSKAVRRGGVDGSKYDFPHSSTGGNVVHEDDVRPSEPAHSNPKRVPEGGIVKTVGNRPDGSGRYDMPDYSKTMHAHGSDGHHEPAKSTDGASGQSHSASGGKFGRPTQRPAASRPNTRTADAGALAGSPKARTTYQGGKGPVR